MSEDRKKTRSLRNLFIRPEKQVRITFAILSFGILSMGMLTAYFMYYLSALEQEMKMREPISAVLLESFIGPMFTKLVAGQLALWIVSIVLGLVITHKIYGPVVPILRHIGKLSEGDYSSRVRLRDGDEMNEIAQALNGLASELEKKSGKPG